MKFTKKSIWTKIGSKFLLKIRILLKQYIEFHSDVSVHQYTHVAEIFKIIKMIFFLSLLMQMDMTYHLLTIDTNSNRRWQNWQKRTLLQAYVCRSTWRTRALHKLSVWPIGTGAHASHMHSWILMDGLCKNLFFHDYSNLLRRTNSLLPRSIQWIHKSSRSTSVFRFLKIW